jgi:hypothetical protein
MLAIAGVALLLTGCQAPPTDPTLNQVAPSAADYPPGPYGYTQGTTIANLQLNGKRNETENPASYSTFPMEKIQLSDFYKKSDVKLLVLSGVARWCTPCNDENGLTTTPGTVAAIEPTYHGKGVRFVEALIEGMTRGVLATPHDIDLWALDHELRVDIALDPNDSIHQYADLADFPLNMVVRTSDMKIMFMATGELDLTSVLDSLL